MKYYIKVFGCQMNQSDAERVSSILEKNKLKQAASADEADLVIFVTCGVRQSAEDRVYGQINNIKKKYPKKKIVVTGCLAHRKDVQKRLKGKVNLFTTIKDFPIRVSPFLKGGLRGISASKFRNPSPTLPSKKGEGTDYLEISPKYTNTYTAYVPIMSGCNNFCAYCVVPHARGREYSRPAEDILKEVKGLVKKGYKEIILLGQNVNSYNSKLSYSKFIQNSKFKIQNSGAINFAKLLKIIEAIPGNFWLTFLTSHPKDMSDELIKTIAGSKKICEYISLPAQSGDNEILRRMNRKYTIEHYKNLIKKIRKHIHDASISTDIIVGFPGETKKQFENTAKLLRDVKYDMAYIAQYSPRPETAAWKMKDNVSKAEKVRREKVLTKILEKTALENNKKYIGKVVEVLVDSNLSLRSRLGERSNPEQLKNTGSPRSLRSLAMTYMAHTRTQKKVLFSSTKKIPVGKFAKVKITKAKAFGLEGEIL